MEKEKKVVDPSVIPPCPVDRWTINIKKCILCLECVDACTRGLLEEKDNMITINNERLCNQCGDCVAVCGYYAITLT